MVREFKCPVDVSPLIRASRWFMLIAGVGYGTYWQVTLQRREDIRRAQLSVRSHSRPEPDRHLYANFNLPPSNDQGEITATAYGEEITNRLPRRPFENNKPLYRLELDSGREKSVEEAATQNATSLKSTSPNGRDANTAVTTTHDTKPSDGEDVASSPLKRLFKKFQLI